MIGLQKVYTEPSTWQGWYDFFKSRYNWFTVLHQFPLYSIVTQWYIHTDTHTHTHTHTHTYTFFLLYYLPSRSIPRDWLEFNLLHSRTSLLIHSICKSLHLPAPQFSGFHCWLLEHFVDIKNIFNMGITS